MRFILLLLFIVGLKSSTFARQSAIYINEFMASNVSTYADIVDFDDFSDWIELYNDEKTPVDIGGFYITDDLSNPMKWQIPSNTIIPAKGYYIIWADDYDDVPGQEYIREWWPGNIKYTTQWSHTNFKLAKEGEEIGFYNASGQLVDAIQFGTQTEDVSYGRKPDGGSNWMYFGEPTPKASNTTDGNLSVIVASGVLFSTEGGFYDNPINVSLSSTSVDVEIRYTLDGSEPSSLSNLYSDPISITNNTIIKARVFEDNKTPSEVFSGSYFIGETRNLPSFSIIADQNYLMGSEQGIILNTLKEREIPVNLEYFPLDRERGFSQRVGIRIGGENIFRFAQKPLNIYASGSYGESQIEYQVFDHLPYQAYKRLYLRNSGDDWPNTMLRDGMIASILSNEVSNCTQAYRPTVLYLNGDYWGLYNLREKLDKQYFTRHFGTAEVDLDHLESSTAIIEGDNTDYNELLDFAETNDLSIASNYEEVIAQIDVHNLMDFVITQAYLSNSSWGHNREMWRDRGNDNLWRWVLVDMDRGFNVSRIDRDLISDLYQEFELFRSLTSNDDFLNKFLQRFSERINTTFDENRVISIIDSLQAQIAPEMPRHIEMWGTYIDSLSIPEWGEQGGVQSMTFWNNEVEKFRTFAQERPSNAIENLQDLFNLGDRRDLTILSNISNKGKVEMNGFFNDIGTTNKYFEQVPMKIKASAPPGYAFKEWKLYNIIDGNSIEINTFSTEEIEIELNADTELVIEFEAISSSFLSSSIIEPTTLSKTNSPYFVNQDVTIQAGATLTIEHGVEVKFDDNTAMYIKGSLTVNGTTNDLVSFSPYYDGQQWKGLFFDNATGESNITNAIITQTKGIENDENFFSSISAVSSTVNLDGVQITDVLLPISSQFSDMRIENSVISNVTLIGDYLNVNGGNLWVLNTVFEGNNIEDMDAIDIGFMEGTTIISGNIFRDFIGDNSDAIDVGDASKDVMITNNVVSNCGDKSVSIGQNSYAYIAYNVFENCNFGVGIKDEGSFGEIVNNTFHNNNVGVAVYEKVLNRGGGMASIVNSIFSNSQEVSASSDEFSSLTVSYSISDTDQLPGDSNLFQDPELINADGGIFYPQVYSPVLNAGDPNTPIDGGGQPINIGALYYQGETNPDLVINEINYNSIESFDTEDWIEFYNASRKVLDVSGWVLIDGSKKQSYVFEQNKILQPNELVVIARQHDLFKTHFSNVDIEVDTMKTGLSGSGESLYLYNSQGQLVDSLTYGDENPWPVQADGNGASLELINPWLDNSMASNWTSSQNNGSPGTTNSNFLVNINEEDQTIPNELKLDQNYPNPFNPSTTIKFSIPNRAKIQLEVFDLLGRKVSGILNEVRSAGQYSIDFDASQLSSGLYIYRLQVGNKVLTKKMTLIK